MVGILQRRKGKSNISSKLPKVTQLVNMRTVWTQAFQLLFEWFFITGSITGYLLWQTILTSKWLKQYMFMFYDTIQHSGCQLEGWGLCTPLSLPSTGPLVICPRCKGWERATRLLWKSLKFYIWKWLAYLLLIFDCPKLRKASHYCS